MMKAASAKAKGRKLEAAVVQDLKSAGLEARLQPGSGIYRDFPHDVEATLRGKRFIIECKARKDSFRQLDGWMGEADVLVVRCDRATPRVYMHWETFLSIAREDDVDEAG